MPALPRTVLRDRLRAAVDELAEANADRQPLAAENGALRDERDALSARVDELVAQRAILRRELDALRAAALDADRIRHLAALGAMPAAS